MRRLVEELREAADDVRPDMGQRLRRLAVGVEQLEDMLDRIVDEAAGAVQALEETQHAQRR